LKLNGGGAEKANGGAAGGVERGAVKLHGGGAGSTSGGSGGAAAAAAAAANTDADAAAAANDDDAVDDDDDDGAPALSCFTRPELLMSISSPAALRTATLPSSTPKTTASPPKGALRVVLRKPRRTKVLRAEGRQCRESTTVTASPTTKWAGQAAAILISGPFWKCGKVSRIDQRSLLKKRSRALPRGRRRRGGHGP
jgi:hypothetical protein